MQLPNGDRAVVDLAKLRDYCLNPTHPRGRHKARVFASVLGLTADHAEELRVVLLAAAVSNDAVATDADDYGQRYEMDVRITGPAAEGWVRTGWIIRADEDFPRLTSCYVR
jgi:Domain of unknown function (DUF6883)